MIQIRECLKSEISLLDQIEEQADSIFPKGLIPQGMQNYPVSSLERARTCGSVLLACQDQEIVGFAVAETIGSAYHLFLIAVLPDWGRKGIGSALLEQIEVEAVNRGLDQLTLTTFSNVAWNAPFYLKKGFSIIPYKQASERLTVILNAEVADGYTNRVAMRKLL